MKIKKLARTIIGANLMVLFAFAFLPALLFNPDLEAFQSVLNYITKD